MNLQNRNLTIELQGEDVKLLQTELRQLGYTIPEDEIRRAHFGKGTQGAVQAFQKQYHFESNGIVDAPVAVRINRVFEMTEGGRYFFVRGIIQVDGKSLSRAVVRAFDKDLRSEELLAEATTDENGSYEMRYTTAEFGRAEAKSADLCVRVYQAEGRELGSSAIRFNASRDETVDLFIGNTTDSGPSEFEELLAQITPLLQGLSLSELREDREFQDITFLYGETTVDPNRLNCLVMAHRWLGQTRLAAEGFYGLLRQNMPTDLAVLVCSNSELLRRALQASLEGNIIPSSFKERMDSFLEQLASHEVQHPTFLVRPESMFVATGDLDHMPTEQARFISEKLNEQFHREIVKGIGPVTPPLTRAIMAVVATLDFRPYRDTNLTNAITEGIFSKFNREMALAEEAATVTLRLNETAPQTIGELLGLSLPITKNPLFENDLWRARLTEYARVAQLDAKLIRQLLQRGVLLDDNSEETLSRLIKEGVLNEQQKTNLHLILELGKLSGDNLPLLSALQRRNLKSIADLASWEESDWQRVLAEEHIRLPATETAENYAKTMVGNLEKAFPSQVLLSRAARRAQATNIRGLDSLDELFRRHDRLLDKWADDSIDWSGVDASQRETMQRNLKDIAETANCYRHLGIFDLLQDKALNLDQKKQAIRSRLEAFITFQRNNPELDLRQTDFFKRDNRFNWQDVPEKEQPLIRKQLMAQQRVLNLGPNDATRQQLLSRGLDSAVLITNYSESEFVHRSGLELGIARMTYATAQEQALGVAHTFELVRDAIKGQFKDFSVANYSADLVNDLREIDGFADLFGSQDYCDCEHCRSILSPAAYFVDLMHFTDHHVSRPVFIVPKQTKHPLYLKNRRSDLWKIKLTCENTHTLIPYLTLVNEVLQQYLETIIAGDIFKKMSDPAEKISFALPSNLPLAELRLYLGHFELALHDLYQFLGEPESKIRRARLALSAEEFTVITTPDPIAVKLRFGNASSLAAFPVCDDQNRRGFINYLGINRAQLDELLTLTFNPDLKNISIGKKSIPGELQNFPEILNNLTEARLDFIHRFIRLWKTTSWTISEFDLVLTSLQEAGMIGADIDVGTALTLAPWIDLQEKLKLKVEELCPLVNQLPVSREFPKPATKQAERLFYERLFDLKKLFGEANPATHELNVSTTFHHYSLNTNNPNDQSIDPKTPMLLAGLGISETDLLLFATLLKNDMPFDTDGNATLDRRRISLLYRHARLAKALKLNVDDFLQTLRLIFPPADQVITTIAQIQKLKQFRDWLKSSPFSVSELRFILTGEESNGVKYKSTIDVVAALVQEVQSMQSSNLLEELKTSLARSFNLASEAFSNTLQWIAADINGASIQTALSATFTNGTPDNPADLNGLLDLMKQLERPLAVFNNLKFKEPATIYLTQNPAELGIADLKSLTLSDLKHLNSYKLLVSLNEAAEPIIQRLLHDYHIAGAFSAANIGPLADLWQVEASLIDSLIDTLTLPANSIDAMDHLRQGLNYCRTLGVNGYSLEKVANDTNYDALVAARDIALGAFSAKYDDETVLQEKLEPYLDRINMQKRDALCDYIIARQKDLKFKDRSDIYAFFLLDVEMSGCFRTSRLVCAISSLQLYIHRCLVNLEQSDPLLNPGIPDIKVPPSSIPAEEWEWRKHFRVWEANRKVFLFPEAYLLSSLRDNKTPIFKDLEDELLQEKVTKESADAAYRKYMAQFSELTRLKIAGTYYHPATDTYYFFAHTQQDPPQYYYRKWDGTTWAPWEKIEIAINAPYVAAEIHLGRLYVFWVEGKSKDKTTIVGGNSQLAYYEIQVGLRYSYLDEKKKWITPQKLDWLFPSETETVSAANKIFKEEDLQEMLVSKTYLKVYPKAVGNSVVIRYYNRHLVGIMFDRQLDLFNNRLFSVSGLIPNVPKSNSIMLYYASNSAQLGVESYDYQTELYFDRVLEEPANIATPHTYLTDPFPYFVYNKLDVNRQDVMHLVHNGYPQTVFTFGNQQYLIRKRTDLWHEVFEYSTWTGGTSPATRRAGWEMIRLSTSLANELGQILFNDGLEELFSLKTQALIEKPLGFIITDMDQLLPPYADPKHLDFKGPYGEYYRELFFHIPYLIGDHLNANQNFKEAKWWYERIFNPTAAESPSDKKATDRNWRFIEFRDVTVQSMKQILTDSATIEAYKKDPFNPHAIARLRMSAYQKAIVMKYIDNLLDWGDALFAEDTMESINEATMLYVLAADILGKRPKKLGKCEAASEDKLTYEDIGALIDQGSEFLIALENWQTVTTQTQVVAATKVAKVFNSFKYEAQTVGSYQSDREPSVLNTDRIRREALITVANQHPNLSDEKIFDRVERYEDAVKSKDRWKEIAQEWAIEPAIKLGKNLPAPAVAKQSTLVFCVPPNFELLKYWDRVEDRLYKIRHCMNLSGIRRQLALFQPLIDPMALIKAKAAGLSLEEMMKLMNAPLPPYRFSYLIEKAKAFSQTVQSFGNTLLLALEKKDIEELTQLRSVHERTILRMTKEIKKQQIRDAQFQVQALIESQTNLQNKINYFNGLIEEGLIGWEITQQISRHTATGMKLLELPVHLLAGITYLIPSVGSPFAMKYGGQELGHSGAEFALWTSSMAAIADAIAFSSGLEATFQRREQEWEFQLQATQQEYKQVEQQRLAGEAKQLLAERDLEIYEKNVEQTEELGEFHKSKFSNLGLYNYLATSLTRLYRQAFNAAYEVAKMAEVTYQFERDDATITISGDNWQFDRAGLLAGERLTFQLQQLEKAYLQQNKRDYEVTQSFSLSLINPSALLLLKKTGSCDFAIPEILLDIYYPGQYRRIIKSVRMTIPCVSGPYSNISAKLTLKQSLIRKEPTTNPADLIVIPNAKLTSIATSNAQNDGGAFDLNFRDERYLPFEGAGAVSTWGIELPSKIRLFDYDTISDVILHVSYTAKDDGALRTTIETDLEETLHDYASTEGLYRILSLRHEFPNAFHRLMNPTGPAQMTEFEFSYQHLPFFLRGKDLQISAVTVYLQPKGDEPVDTTGLTLKVNGANVSGGWSVLTKTNLQEAKASLSGSPIKKWTLHAGANGLDKEQVDDILILVKYAIA